jgi:hypothetical protein
MKGSNNRAEMVKTMGRNMVKAVEGRGLEKRGTAGLDLWVVGRTLAEVCTSGILKGPRYTSAFPPD